MTRTHRTLIFALLAGATLALVVLLWHRVRTSRSGLGNSVETSSESETTVGERGGWRGTGKVGAPGRHAPEPAPRTLPKELAEKARPWSPRVGTYEQAAEGEEAPVRAYSIGQFDPTQPGPPPEPFARPKLHLDKADIRAGLD